MSYPKIFLVLAVVFNSFSLVHAQNVELATGTDSVNYYFGYMQARQWIQSGIDLNTDIMSQGMKDAVADVAPTMNQDEINMFFQRYFTNLQAQVNAKNLQEGREFLEENRKKAGVTVLPSGLQYKVIRPGTGPTPGQDDEVEIFYHGTLTDGTVFDSAKDRGMPVTFQPTQVIPGFSEALMLMNEGALWEIYIPAELGYGENVNPQSGIKPNSVLIFEIEMLKIIKGTEE